MGLSVRVPWGKKGYVRFGASRSSMDVEKKCESEMGPLAPCATSANPHYHEQQGMEDGIEFLTSGMDSLPGHREELNPAMLSASSGSSSDNGANPQHISSGESNGLNLRETDNFQVVFEAGANNWELILLWRLKCCLNAGRSCLGRVGVPAILSMLAVIVLAIVGRRWYCGPALQVQHFLNGIELGEYYSSFIDNKYEWLEDVIHITQEEDLIELNMLHKAHRSRFLRHAEMHRNQKSMVLALIWAWVVLSCITVSGVCISVFVSEEARKRVSCLMVWSFFMAWHRVRMYLRLWQKLNTLQKPQLGRSEEHQLGTPGSTVNPPDASLFANSAPS